MDTAIAIVTKVSSTTIHPKCAKIVQNLDAYIVMITINVSIAIIRAHSSIKMLQTIQINKTSQFV